MKYQHLLSPIKIGNVVFKNRMGASPSSPNFIQGSEPHPTEPLINHYANKARNGAAYVTVKGIGPVTEYTPRNLKTVYGLGSKPVSTEHTQVRPETLFNKNSHNRMFDPTDGCVQNYISQLADTIHFYGSKASFHLWPSIASSNPEGYDVSSGIPFITIFGNVWSHHLYGPNSGKEIPAEMLPGIADECAAQCALMQELGFDMVYLHMSYRATIFGRFLSPLTNQRTDKYGGSLANRARFAIMVAEKIKERCGRNFIIEASMSGVENYPGGITLNDTVEYAKLFAGHIDLLQLRAGDLDPTHPTGYNPERTPFLYMAEAVKKSGANIASVAIGGFTDLESCENAIASGKADFIAMARSWISNPHFGRLAYEGRGEDVIPCIRCNKCHKSSFADPWVNVCSVNPVWGLEHKIEKLVDAPIDKKKVVIIGGGPAGMEAALISAERGHRVTLYEKSGALGGLLKTCDYVPFKWPQKEFKDYLIYQINKSNIKVCLNTEAPIEILKTEANDVVIAALGSEPIVPPISGIQNGNVVYAPNVYGNDSTLGKNIVIIGGGEIGVETGIFLAQKGHKVTLLEMLNILAPDVSPLHFYTMFRDVWEKENNFKYILQARCTTIDLNKVTYLDANGKEHDIQADNVVIAAGMKSKSDLAMKFYGVGKRFFMIGDCDKAANIQKAIRSAFSAASSI
jgi:2,4-dienoyl-CoA reductase-like NADH-dependent reductase (Old Yellow Enzyme family)/thioredoxin reductase